MYDSHAISTTGVVTAVIEPRLIDTASESVGWLSSSIVYTIENPTNTMQVEEWITSKLTLTTVTMANGDQAMMTKQRHGLDKPRHGSGPGRIKNQNHRSNRACCTSRLFEHL